MLFINKKKYFYKVYTLKDIWKYTSSCYINFVVIKKISVPSECEYVYLYICKLKDTFLGDIYVQSINILTISLVMYFFCIFGILDFFYIVLTLPISIIHATQAVKHFKEA